MDFQITRSRAFSLPVKIFIPEPPLYGIAEDRDSSVEADTPQCDPFPAVHFLTFASGRLTRLRKGEPKWSQEFAVPVRRGLDQLSICFGMIIRQVFG